MHVGDKQVAFLFLSSAKAKVNIHSKKLVSLVLDLRSLTIQRVILPKKMNHVSKSGILIAQSGKFYKIVF